MKNGTQVRQFGTVMCSASLHETQNKAILKLKLLSSGNETLHLTWVLPVIKSREQNVNKGNIVATFLIKSDGGESLPDFIGKS